MSNDLLLVMFRMDSWAVKYGVGLMKRSWMLKVLAFSLSVGQVVLVLEHYGVNLYVTF